LTVAKTSTELSSRDASPADAALTVYYDGACPLCRREIDFYRTRKTDVPISWVDVSGVEVESLGADLTRDEALTRFHVRLPDGRLVRGARGFGELWAVTRGFRWLGSLATTRAVLPVLELAYRAFLPLRPALQGLLKRIEVDAPNAWLRRELRSNHAGEAGAVSIYRGVLAIGRCASLRRFATRHLATEQRHLELMRELVPREQRSKLLPLWRAAGFTTGALPALFGARAVYATIESVEHFVDHHYSAQIDRLTDDPSCRELRELLTACRDEELAHRDEARACITHAPGPLLNLWLRAVSVGSALGVRIARRV
jgi:ubiquinone biosynthesis monooxygenase Coq7